MYTMESQQGNKGAAYAAAVERLRSAVGYPDAEGASALVVDGAEIAVLPGTGSRLRLERRLSADAGDLERLASYAPGRMLRDKAVLAADDAGRPFLWQEAPDSLDERALRRFFEEFLDSCDWWLARLETIREQPAARFPEVMIRP